MVKCRLLKKKNLTIPVLFFNQSLFYTIRPEIFLDQLGVSLFSLTSRVILTSLLTLSASCFRVMMIASICEISIRGAITHDSARRVNSAEFKLVFSNTYFHTSVVSVCPQICIRKVVEVELLFGYWLMLSNIILINSLNMEPFWSNELIWRN